MLATLPSFPGLTTGAVTDQKKRLVRWQRQRGTSLVDCRDLDRVGKLNDAEPLAWLTDVLERIVSGRTKNHELDKSLPWNWKAAKNDDARTGDAPAPRDRREQRRYAASTPPRPRINANGEYRSVSFIVTVWDHTPDVRGNVWRPQRLRHLNLAA
jgi:hypothetical protein